MTERVKRQRASEEDTLGAWAELQNAIQRVECALPSQMSEAINQLTFQRRAFDDLLCGRPLPPPPPVTP